MTHAVQGPAAALQDLQQAQQQQLQQAQQQTRSAESESSRGNAQNLQHSAQGEAARRHVPWTWPNDVACCVLARMLSAAYRLNMGLLTDTCVCQCTHQCKIVGSTCVDITSAIIVL